MEISFSWNYYYCYSRRRRSTSSTKASERTPHIVTVVLVVILLFLSIPASRAQRPSPRFPPFPPFAQFPPGAPRPSPVSPFQQFPPGASTSPPSSSARSPAPSPLPFHTPPAQTDPAEHKVLFNLNVVLWFDAKKNKSDPCQLPWTGVYCDGGAPFQHVIAINLTGTTNGIIAAEFFSRIVGLTHLTNLSLTSCSMSGTIPSTFSSLSSLRFLDLSDNAFTEFPQGVGDFASLQSLTLSENEIEGKLPDVLCQLKSLEVLKLEGNNISGTIPPCLENLSNLTVLSIGPNSLSGPIPDSIGSLGSLKELNLAQNSLTGSLPASLTRLSNLEKLHLSGNMIDGDLPTDFDNMGKLQELYLDSNKLWGTIPITLCKVQSLVKLRLSDNQLSGPIPDQIGNLSGLTVLFLHANKLSGPLPLTMANLSSLEQLQLQGNRLNGTLPGSILAGLTNITSVYLHRNDFEGEIPLQAIFLSLLTNISLGFNRFNGSIPNPASSSESPILVKLKLISTCRNELTGPIPPDVGKLGFVDYLDFSNNLLNGSLPPSLASLASTSNHLQSNFVFNNLDDDGTNSSSNLLGGAVCLQQRFLMNSPIMCNRGPGSSKGIAINVGGMEYTSSIGVYFAADNKFVQQMGYYVSPPSTESSKVASSSWMLNAQGVEGAGLPSNDVSPAPPGFAKGDWTLFQSARTGADSLSYTVNSLQRGEYIVQLFFAELDSSITQAGQRVFSVLIQGHIEVEALDVFNRTGGMMLPLILPFPIYVENGTVDIQLLGRGSWPATEELMTIYRGPILSAISIQQKKKSNRGMILAAAVGGGGLGLLLSLTACFACGYVLLQRRRRVDNSVSLCNWNNVGLLQFSLAELEAATNKFSDGNLLGQGAFGKVYKGILPDGATIAIKQLSIPNRNSVESLQNELQVISTVRHRNLVSLIGCCLELDCPILVCQYMPNGNLHDALFKESSPISLSWATRCKIALDIGRGLHYLHEESVHKIVHRDVKPVNILLDSMFNAHIADFGMARLLADQEIEVITDVMGTRGYLSPEYALNGQLSDKVDVFSYGVVLMELVIGKRGMQNSLDKDDKIPEKIPLCQWAWQMFAAGKCEELVDSKLGDDFVFEDFMRILQVSLWCTEYYQSLRPSMSQALLMLTKKVPIPPIPLERKGYEDLREMGPFSSQRWVSMTITKGDQGPAPSSTEQSSSVPWPKSFQHSSSLPWSYGSFQNPELSYLPGR